MSFYCSSRIKNLIELNILDKVSLKADYYHKLFKFWYNSGFWDLVYLNKYNGDSIPHDHGKYFHPIFHDVEIHIVSENRRARNKSSISKL